MTHRPLHATRVLLTAMAAILGAASTTSCLAQAGTTSPIVQAPADAPPVTPGEMVDALNSVFGKQTTNRAVHAKGIVLEGRFIANRNAASFSKAPHFRGAPVALTVRFSDFAGVPNIPDNDGLASPRGMALKFHLADGTETDLVTHSFNGFPSATADDFTHLLMALGASGPSVPQPSPAARYLATHPVAKTFLETQAPPPASYATLNYYGVNTFKFTNARDEVTFARYQIVPEAGIHYLSADDAKSAAPDYLFSEMRQRVALAPIRFTMRAQFSGPQDKLDDPSVAWPDSRPTLDLGTIEITRVDADSEAAQRRLIFMPATLPPGIEPADPMIAARSSSYPISYSRRHQ